MHAKELNIINGQEGWHLLDVRTPVEFRQAFIRGSVNMPVSDIVKGTMPEIPEGARLCLICQSGKRAEKARLYLKERYGLEAEILEGGVDAWKAQGLALEKDPSFRGLPLMRQVQLAVGVFNLAGFLLAWLVSPFWLALPVITSMGLVFAGATGFCGLAFLLSAMPWNRSCKNRCTR